jgi:hypothetical protein
MREAARINRRQRHLPPEKRKYYGLVTDDPVNPTWTGRVRFWEPALNQPLKWRRAE